MKKNTKEISRHRVSLDLNDEVYKAARLKAIELNTKPKKLLEDFLNTKYKA